jgi:hypothetical protein
VNASVVACLNRYVERRWNMTDVNEYDSPNTRPFSRPTFRGARFNRTGLPATMASEIATFDRAIRAIARQLYIERFGRVPSREFAADFDLRLMGEIHSNSNTAVLGRPISAQGQLFAEAGLPDIFDDAKNVLLQALRWANIASLDDRGPPNDLSKAALKECAWVGRHLAESDSLSFDDPETGLAGAVCTRTSRRRIAAAAEENATVERTTAVGRLTGTRYEPVANFRMKLLGRERSVEVRLTEPALSGVLSGLGPKRIVVVRGDGHFRLRDHEMTTIEGTADPYSVNDREGQPLKRTLVQFDATVRSLAEAVAAVSPVEERLLSLLRQAWTDHRSPLPILARSSEGGITVDWVRAPWRIGGELEPDSKTIELFAVHQDRRPPEYRSIEISATDAIGELVEFVSFERTDGSA